MLLQIAEAPGVGKTDDLRARLTVARQPSTREFTIVDNLLIDRLRYFRDNSGSAEQLLSNPQFVYKPGHSSKIELAAWFFVANALLNLDETITRN